MSGSWIKDRPEAVEHPVVPLGLNEMTVPRTAIVASFATIALLVLSAAWVGWGAYQFSLQFDTAFHAVSEEELQEDGRWAWEVTLLLDDCESREGDWAWPENLSAQDDFFWLPGEVACNWAHQGEGDWAGVAIHNPGEDAIALSVEVDHDAISIDDQGPSTIVQLEAGDAMVVPIRLVAALEDDFQFARSATHVSLPSATVTMDVSVYADGGEQDRHVRSERLHVAYTVWDVDTGEQLDDGNLPATAGADPMCETGAPWICYIEGFGWGLVGLDANMVESVTFSGTTHTVLLPPELAYGASEGHELEHSWLRFELELEQLIV